MTTRQDSMTWPIPRSNAAMEQRELFVDLEESAVAPPGRRPNHRQGLRDGPSTDTNGECGAGIQHCAKSRRFGVGVTFPTRIGISADLVVTGAVGGGAGLRCTVYKDGVYLGQRQEETNKQAGPRVLLSARTAEFVQGYVEIRPLVPIVLPGRDGNVAAYTGGQKASSVQDPVLLPIFSSSVGRGEGSETAAISGVETPTLAAHNVEAGEPDTRNPVERAELSS